MFPYRIGLQNGAVIKYLWIINTPKVQEPNECPLKCFTAGVDVVPVQKKRSTFSKDFELLLQKDLIRLNTVFYLYLDISIGKIKTVRIQSKSCKQYSCI